TGLRILSIPPGTYGRVAPRSGLALRKGLDVFAGVVDADYWGLSASCCTMYNSSDEEVTVAEGDRVTQLILETYCDAEIGEGTLQEEDPTQRGDGGFGSTGD
ncbi:unnamed protein product, partial [Chrysoparadoxa australica]